MIDGQPIEHFVDRCLDDIRRGYRIRNTELRRKARQALIDALACKQEIRSEQVRRMAEDAARYRWLRDPCSGAERVIFYCRGDYGRGLMSSAVLDAAIDAAMSKEGK